MNTVSGPPDEDAHASDTQLDVGDARRLAAGDTTANLRIDVRLAAPLLVVRGGDGFPGELLVDAGALTLSTDAEASLARDGLPVAAACGLASTAFEFAREAIEATCGFAPTKFVAVQLRGSSVAWRGVT